MVWFGAILSDIFHWHWVNETIDLVPLKEPSRIWAKVS